MPSKKFDLVRQLESKLDNQRKASGVPGRFGEAAAALPDRKAQRKADAAAGLVPFACKLPAPLAARYSCCRMATTKVAMYKNLIAML